MTYIIIIFWLVFLNSLEIRLNKHKDDIDSFLIDKTDELTTPKETNVFQKRLAQLKNRKNLEEPSKNNLVEGLNYAINNFVESSPEKSIFEVEINKTEDKSLVNNCENVTEKYHPQNSTAVEKIIKQELLEEEGKNNNIISNVNNKTTKFDDNYGKTSHNQNSNEGNNENNVSNENKSNNGGSFNNRNNGNNTPKNNNDNIDQSNTGTNGGQNNILENNENKELESNNHNSNPNNENENATPDLNNGNQGQNPNINQNQEKNTINNPQNSQPKNEPVWANQNTVPSFPQNNTIYPEQAHNKTISLNYQNSTQQLKESEKVKVSPDCKELQSKESRNVLIKQLANEKEEITKIRKKLINLYLKKKKTQNKPPLFTKLELNNPKTLLSPSSIIQTYEKDKI